MYAHIFLRWASCQWILYKYNILLEKHEEKRDQDVDWKIILK